MITFPEQLARLARDLPAMEYGSNAWRAVRAYFPGAVGKDEAEHVCESIARLRAENAKLREALAAAFEEKSGWREKVAAAVRA